MNDAPPQIRPGELVANGHYRVIARVGGGRMSDVYAAESLSDPNVRVAVKVLRQKWANDANAMDRFRQEASIARELRSKHVARFINAGLDRHARPWIAFELFDGESLDRVLPYGRSDLFVGPEDAIWIMEGIFQGLVDAHEAGIIHRDLKPSNVAIVRDPDGTRRALLLDFGVSKLVRALSQHASSQEGNQPALTAIGATLGTLGYMPPEQIGAAANVDGRADTYAAAVILFRILTGRLPFFGKGRAQADWKRAYDPLTFEGATGVLFPKEIQDFSSVGMARMASDRFASARAALEAWRSVMRALADVTLPRIGVDFADDDEEDTLSSSSI